MPTEKTKARFFEPMLLLATNSLPQGEDWEYELKLDGYRAVAFKSNGRVQFCSRSNKDFALRYPAITSALQKLPDETVIDGEVVAFDDSGRPSFNTLQNFGSSTGPIFYYAFDLLILGGKDVRFKPLERRRELLKTKVLSKLHEPIRYSPSLDASLPDLIRSVREQRLEGLVAKRRTSVYESGQRSGVWLKMRVNRGQEFVIAGYTPGPKNFDALIFGYYEGDKLAPQTGCSSVSGILATKSSFAPNLNGCKHWKIIFERTSRSYVRIWTGETIQISLRESASGC